MSQNKLTEAALFDIEKQVNELSGVLNTGTITNINFIVGIMLCNTIKQLVSELRTNYHRNGQLSALWAAVHKWFVGGLQYSNSPKKLAAYHVGDYPMLQGIRNQTDLEKAGNEYDKYIIKADREAMEAVLIKVIKRAFFDMESDSIVTTVKNKTKLVISYDAIDNLRDTLLDIVELNMRNQPYVRGNADEQRFFDSGISDDGNNSE